MKNISRSYPSINPERFERENWRLYVENAKQAQDEKSFGHKRTLFLMEGTEFEHPTSCRIMEDEKIIFCGIKPEEMGFL